MRDNALPSHFDPEPLLRPASLMGLAQWTERIALAHSLGTSVASTGAPSVVRRGAVVAYCAAIPSPSFNRVFIGGEGDAPQADDVDHVLRHVLAREDLRPLVHIHATDRSDAIADVLRAHRLTPFRRRWIKLMREAGPVPTCPTRLTIRAAHHEDASTMADVAIQAHGLQASARPLLMSTVARPHWHSYVACDGDRVVAAGTLLVRGDVGYLSLGATLPSHRGQGAQSALLEKRLRVAFALGCRRVFAETGEAIVHEPNPSFENMRRVGMQPIGMRDNYALAGTTWS